MKGGKDIKDIIIVDGKMVDRRTFLKIAGTAAGSMLLAGSFPGMLEATPGKGEYLFEKVTMCRGGEPQTMDATISVDRVALIMYLHIYDRLVTRDRNTMKLIPQMATGWEIVDNRHWRFKLKEGIKFHDGTEFDADSVKFTMDRIMDPKVASPGAASYRGLKETAVIDKYTVEFRFDKFFPIMTAQLYIVSGYPNGFKLKMGGPIGRFLKDQEMGTAVVGYLREIGIDVDYRPEPWSIYYPKWKRKDPPWDMVYHGWGGYSTFDPEGTLPYLIETGGPQSRYSNKEVDALIKQGREESHVKKREKIYHKMMEILHDDPPWIYLTTHVDIHGYRSRLTFSARPDELMSARDIGKS